MGTFYYNRTTGELVTGATPKGGSFSTTEISPPSGLKHNQSAIFNGESWEVKESTPELPSEEELRLQRDTCLQETDFLVQRDSEEKALGLQPSLHATKLEALLLYRQELRDLPQNRKWPAVEFPECPILIP